MKQLTEFFESFGPVEAALFAGLFTWGVTVAGAALVFFFKKASRMIMDSMLGLAGGIMLAAAFWSLLLPSVEMSPLKGMWKVLPTVIGFMSGAFTLFLFDKIMPHIHLNFKVQEGIKTSWHRTVLLVLAITLHNIPEGLAIGVLFGAAGNETQALKYGAALLLTLGIAIQNFPEGFAVSIPLRRQGLSRMKSFVFGALSAVVEPVGAVLGAWLVYRYRFFLPYALAYAAGAMIFVVIEEAIPETQQDRFTDHAAMGFITGFSLMMLLDVGLS